MGDISSLCNTRQLFYKETRPNWGVASLRRVLCGWPALVGWRFLCVCAFDGFLLWVRIASACPIFLGECMHQASIAGARAFKHTLHAVRLAV